MGVERVERRLAAIVAVDVAGYSRLMGRDEEGTSRCCDYEDRLSDGVFGHGMYSWNGESFRETGCASGV